MNGQYLMNKDVSVQYAYKKDGKGERHGDEAERTLASQAKKHNVVPEGGAVGGFPGQMMLMGGVPSAPAAMLDPSGHQSSFSGPAAPAPPPGFARQPQQQAYNSVPPPSGMHARPSNPLPPPPSGLPQRPPPSMGGYNGPQDFAPPGFAPPEQQGFGGPPMPPPGFGPPPGGQQMPPGFGFPPGQQQQGGFVRSH